MGGRGGLCLVFFLFSFSLAAVLLRLRERVCIDEAQAEVAEAVGRVARGADGDCWLYSRERVFGFS